MPPESERIPTILRQEVALRASHRCEYCLSPDDFSPNSFTVDHIHPRALGGKNTLENLAWACFGCNSRKHTKTTGKDLETGKTVSFFNPRLQDWAIHFAWNEDSMLLQGKTPCGRATIAALNLNRTGVVNLRSLLKSAGLHPPFADLSSS